MSIASIVRTAGPFAGTGSLVALPFAFKVFSASDLVVQRTSTSGAVTTLTLTTHYSVSLNADQDTSPGGTVTLVTALAAGETAALTSSVSATQPLQLASGGPFLPGQIEDALDRAMIVVQQQGVLGEQTLRVPLGETAIILPSADQRANKALLFDAHGDPYLAAPASGSAAELALSLASNDAGKGAANIAVNRDDTVAPETSLGAYIHVRRERFNVMDAVPRAEREAITAGASNYDTLPHYMEAIAYFGAASAAGRGLVETPRGLFKVSGKIPLRFETSMKGLAGRSSRIKAMGDFPVLGWDPAIPSFSRQVSITDLWLIGAGYGLQGATVITMAQAYAASAAGTNMAGIAAAYPGVVPFNASNAIDIDHPWGIDSLTLKRLWIEECPAVGIKTNQPLSGATKNCFQFSDWESIYLRHCNVGISLGYGFTGESSFSNICSQFALLSNLDFTINPALTGPQGINLVNFSTGWSPYGVRMLAGTAGNIKLDMFHAEHHTSAAMYMNSASINNLLLESPWMAANAAGILGDAGGRIGINNGTWRGGGSASDTFIKLNASSNFAVTLAGNHSVLAPVSGSAPTNHISTTDINTIRGAVLRTSATTGSIAPGSETVLTLQARGVMSETATVRPNNFSGGAAIGNGATSVGVTFARAEADAAYRIQTQVDWGTLAGSTWMPAIAIGAKTINGFTASFSSAAPAAGATLNWILTR